MAFNTASEIMVEGRLSLRNFTQTQIELAIEAAEQEINLRVAPLETTHKHYSYYSRRLPTLKEAHCNLTLARLYRTYAYEQIVRGESGNPWGVEGFQMGAYTPEKNTMMDSYIRLASIYQEKAESLLKTCKYILPSVRRPAPLEI